MAWNCDKCGFSNNNNGEGVLGLCVVHGCSHCPKDNGTYSLPKTFDLTLENIKTMTDMIKDSQKDRFKLLADWNGLKIVLDESLGENEYYMVVGKNVWKEIKDMK